MDKWFENEQFWQDLYPYMFDEAKFTTAIAQSNQLLSLLNIKTGKILDLCCGPGRFAVPLAKQGFCVTGVDRTNFLLEKAKHHAAQNSVNIEFVCEDMNSFVRENSFKAAINMFTSFGYFDQEEENLQVLLNIYQSLQPQGKLLIDTLGKELLARYFQPTKSTKYADGTILVERLEIINNWSQVKNEWLLIKDNQVQTYPFLLTVYAGQELIALLQKAGFTNIRLYGDLMGSKYDINASRLIAVAEKASSSG